MHTTLSQRVAHFRSFSVFVLVQAFLRWQVRTRKVTDFTRCIVCVHSSHGSTRKSHGPHVSVLSLWKKNLLRFRLDRKLNHWYGRKTEKNPHRIEVHVGTVTLAGTTPVTGEWRKMLPWNDILFVLGWVGRLESAYYDMWYVFIHVSPRARTHTHTDWHQMQSYL